IGLWELHVLGSTLGAGWHVVAPRDHRAPRQEDEPLCSAGLCHQHIVGIVEQLREKHIERALEIACDSPLPIGSVPDDLEPQASRKFLDDVDDACATGLHFDHAAGGTANHAAAITLSASAGTAAGYGSDPG